MWHTWDASGPRRSTALWEQVFAKWSRNFHLLCQVSSNIHGRLERAGAEIQRPDAECHKHKLERSVLDVMHFDLEK